MKLEGKVAIITGASKGLGMQIAQTFIHEGATVVGCSRTSETIKPYYDWTCDVTLPHNVFAMADRTIKMFGKIDILVCNAGIYGPIDKVDGRDIYNYEHYWLNTFKTNVFGVFNFCREVVPHMKKQGHGKIIILSGGGATKPMPGFSAYAASKAAVVRFGETLAEEVKSFNIQVNSVAPGMLNTNMVDEVLKAGVDKVGKEFYNRNKEIKKLEDNGDKQLAADCIAHLCSDECNITGKLISAVYDNWKSNCFEHWCKEYPDLYTLRRKDKW